MAKVIRLIWRLDFEVSYAYLDRRGSALKILAETNKGFWDNCGPGRVPLSFAAEKLEEDQSFTMFSWEMTNLNGSTEWPTGLEMSRLFESPIMRGIDRIVRDALKLGEVRVLSRAGVRLFGTEKFAKPSERSAMERVGRLTNAQFKDGLTATVGPPKDVAFIYEGADADGLGYRVQFGPYDPKNPTMMFLRPWGTLPEALDENDLFFDIDIYEQNFSFLEHSLFRWASTKVSKAASFVEFCAKNIE